MVHKSCVDKFHRLKWNNRQYKSIPEHWSVVFINVAHSFEKQTSETLLSHMTLHSGVNFIQLFDLHTLVSPLFLELSSHVFIAHKVLVVFLFLWFAFLIFSVWGRVADTTSLWNHQNTRTSSSSEIILWEMSNTGSLTIALAVGLLFIFTVVFPKYTSHPLSIAGLESNPESSWWEAHRLTSKIHTNLIRKQTVTPNRKLNG